MPLILLLVLVVLGGRAVAGDAAVSVGAYRSGRARGGRKVGHTRNAWRSRCQCWFSRLAWVPVVVHQAPRERCSAVAAWRSESSAVVKRCEHDPEDYTSRQPLGCVAVILVVLARLAARPWMTRRPMPDWRCDRRDELTGG